MIVGLNYVLEFVIPSWHQSIIFWLLVSECVSTILITMWYQFVERNYLGQQLVCLAFAVITLVYFWIFVPEGPKWQYTKRIYDKARTTLKYVASSNSKPEQTLTRIMNSKFDLEVLEQKQNQMMMDEEGSATQKDKTEIRSQIS